MLNIILIGAGELGSRHLQGLVKVNHMLNIWVIDPSSESLARAEERLEEIEYDKKRIKTFFSNSLVPLDEPIFLCIILLKLCCSHTFIVFNFSKQTILITTFYFNF